MNKFVKMSREERRSTRFNGDEILIGEVDGNIVTVGPDADGTGTAVFIQIGSLPAVNCFGNETGRSLLEEWRAGNLWVEQEGYHRGSTFAGI